MTRIIDAHLHLFKYREHWSEWAAKRWIEEMPDAQYWYTGRPLQPEDFHAEPDWAVEQMDHAGVDAAILLGNWQTPHRIKVPTSFLREAVDKHPDRFFGFAAPDPLGGWSSVEELAGAYETGFYGLKLLPTYNYVPPLDKRIWPLYELTAAKGKRLIIHTGWGPVPENRLVWQQPYELEELLITFPEMKVSLGHTGFHRYTDAMCLMSKNLQVYSDLAAWALLPLEFLARALVFAKSLGVINRIMWGSDFPHFDLSEELRRLRSIPAFTERHELEPIITDDDIAGILGGNIVRFLDLEPASDDRAAVSSRSSVDAVSS